MSTAPSEPLDASPEARGHAPARRGVRQAVKVTGGPSQGDRHRARRDTSETRYGELPDRLDFVERVGAALSVAGVRVAVIYVELDRLRSVDAALGHIAGEAVLAEAAARLRGILGAAPPLAGVGGNAFGLCVENVVDEAELFAIAESIRWEMAEPFETPNGTVALTASIGIAFGLGPDCSAGDLLQQADCAAQSAAEGGGNRVDVFERRMQVRALTRIRGDAALREALERSEFRLYYQPAAPLSAEHGFGVEALIRWVSAGKRMVMPMNFIPLSEETGFIVTLGAWIFREACGQLARWQKEGLAPSWLSVNLSARQLYVRESIESFEEALSATGADPQRLVLEITESALMEETPLLWQGLDRLRGLGIKLSIDDFGTRYSSLTYLRRFDFDQLKIDRSFVAGLETDKRDRTIVENVVMLAHGLGLDVVVEGIQTAGQLTLAQTLGADWAQGYHLSRPVPAELLPETLTRLATTVERGRPGDDSPVGRASDG